MHSFVTRFVGIVIFGPLGVFTIFASHVVPLVTIHSAYIGRHLLVHFFQRHAAALGKGFCKSIVLASIKVKDTKTLVACFLHNVGKVPTVKAKGGYGFQEGRPLYPVRNAMSAASRGHAVIPVEKIHVRSKNLWYATRNFQGRTGGPHGKGADLKVQANGFENGFGELPQHHCVAFLEQISVTGCCAVPSRGPDEFSWLCLLVLVTFVEFAL
mmetsp:Transcript_4365/g.12006  ORF Transcript_4365/g.12006 Transcript_4365/m.12006 type:complete len:212 (-) Transcript_4365:357-992(-)